MNREHVFVLGLTGSIGMGKSTVASMFRDLGAIIIDSDDIVHRLMEYGGAAVGDILRLCPEAKILNRDGLAGVDRVVLGKWVVSDAGDVRKLESILHPLVSARRGALLDLMERDGKFCLAVLDVPLLFERGIDNECDFVIVVSAGEVIQRERVMSREGMTEERFADILRKQMSDAEKRERADLVLDTGLSLEETKKQVEDIYEKIKSGKIL